MDEIMQCSVCYLDYDTESHKPCIGKCGHTICFVCASDERCEACPVCRRDGSFQEIVVNYVLMNIIEYRNKKKQEVEGICSLCQKEATELAICIDCSLKNGIMMKDSFESQNEDEIGVKWNTANRSLDDCIQQARLSSYCGSCSIGAVHYGHRSGAFKKIQQTIFSKGMSGIKQEIEGFLNSFDKLKKQVNQKLEEYRKNISSLLSYVAQLTFDQFNNYPKRIMEFIVKSKVVLKGLTSCHQNITSSIRNIEKKLVANVQSNCTTKIEEIVYHSTSELLRNLEIYAYNIISNTMSMETQILVPYSCTSILHKNNVYIIGGRKDGNALKKVEVYNLNDKTRRKLPDMNEGRFCPTFCIHNGKIVVYGGYNYDGFVNSLEEYDFDKNEWKIIGRINDDSIDGIVSHENDLYGVGINKNRIITINKFNKEMSVFETVLRTSSVSLPRIRGCTSLNGKIYMIDNEYSCHYNPSANVLSAEGEFVMKKQWDVRLYSLNNQLYAIDSESVEVFDENNNKWNLIWRKQ